jgi:hypothetical protein
MIRTGDDDRTARVRQRDDDENLRRNEGPGPVGAPVAIAKTVPLPAGWAGAYPTAAGPRQWYPAQVRTAGPDPAASREIGADAAFGDAGGYLLFCNVGSALIAVNTDGLLLRLVDGRWLIDRN